VFILTYRDPRYINDKSNEEIFTDIKDLGQALICIVNNPEEERRALAWCEQATFGSKVVRQRFGYKIECVRNINDRAMINKVVGRFRLNISVYNSETNEITKMSFRVDFRKKSDYTDGYLMSIKGISPTKFELSVDLQYFHDFNIDQPEIQIAQWAYTYWNKLNYSIRQLTIKKYIRNTDEETTA